MEKVYAKALLNELAQGKSDADIVSGLSLHLKRVGREKLLPRILRELTSELARARKSETVLEIAHEGVRAEALQALQTLGITPAQVLVNDTLIEGYRVRTKESLLDRSAKQALVDLYKRITA